MSQARDRGNGRRQARAQTPSAGQQRSCKLLIDWIRSGTHPPMKCVGSHRPRTRLARQPHPATSPMQNACLVSSPVRIRGGAHWAGSKPAAPAHPPPKSGNQRHARSANILSGQQSINQWTQDDQCDMAASCTVDAQVIHFSLIRELYCMNNTRYVLSRHTL